MRKLSVENITKSLMMQKSVTRGRDCYSDFQKRTMNAYLHVLEQKKKTNTQETLKHLIVTSISAMEVFFKRCVKEAVDRNINECQKRLRALKGEKITYNLFDIFELVNKKISLGDIISVSQSFQNFDQINTFFSGLLGITSFNSEVERITMGDLESNGLLEVSYTSDLKKARLSKLLDLCPNYQQDIKRMFEYRHTLIHHGDIKGLKTEDILPKFFSLHQYVFCAYYYTRIGVNK